MGHTKHVYFLVGHSQGEIPVVGPGHKWDDNI